MVSKFDRKQFLQFKNFYYLGLTESPVRQRRRSADDSLIIGLNESPKISDDLTSIENLDDLKEIIRNQRKYNQQLQTRIRLNTPDLIQSPVIEKLNEQIQVRNLNFDYRKKYFLCFRI
jgi:type IV secretory pathway VirB4 component